MFDVEILQTSTNVRLSAGTFVAEIVATFGPCCNDTWHTSFEPTMGWRYSWVVHFRRILVYRFYVIRESCRHHRAWPNRLVFRDRAKRRSSVHSCAIDRCAYRRVLLLDLGIAVTKRRVHKTDLPSAKLSNLRSQIKIGFQMGRNRFFQAVALALTGNSRHPRLVSVIALQTFPSKEVTERPISCPNCCRKALSYLLGTLKRSLRVARLSVSH